MNFKVGDRVVGVGSEGGIDLTGMTGKVVVIENKSIAPIGVEFDNPFSGGHTCLGESKDEHGRWCSASVLSHEGEKIEEGQMRKHLSIEVNTIAGWGKLLRIKEQTHRGDEFGEGWNKFIFNDFRLCSAASLTDGCNVFYVRGTNESCDNNVILVPSEEWLIKCCAAVRAYNIYFGGGISEDGVEVIE